MDASSRDLAALQGTWEQVAFEENGVVDAPDSTGAPGALTRISGDRFSVRTRQGELLLEGRFILDASTTPGAITWIDAIGPDAGQPLPASYRLDGDDFVFIAADAGAPRPTEFRTVPGLTMRRFVRWRAQPGPHG
ncbi:TIGR03067 domain-containing protein [Frateuria sp. YIM B11624]|uniref:TIGR03067 domain-containing protein n=1 Tax=Frateuria sp. YIM B11624 TaxID=3143185 RepID=UPI003C75C9DC